MVQQSHYRLVNVKCAEIFPLEFLRRMREKKLLWQQFYVENDGPGLFNSSATQRTYSLTVSEYATKNTSATLTDQVESSLALASIRRNARKTLASSSTLLPQSDTKGRRLLDGPDRDHSVAISWSFSSYTFWMGFLLLPSGHNQRAQTTDSASKDHFSVNCIFPPTDREDCTGLSHCFHTSSCSTSPGWLALARPWIMSSRSQLISR